MRIGACVALCLAIAGCFREAMPPTPPSLNVVACPAVLPLAEAPMLRESHASPCPAGSKLAKCFDAANASALADDIDSLIKDRDYCRGAYEGLVIRGQ